MYVHLYASSGEGRLSRHQPFGWCVRKVCSRINNGFPRRDNNVRPKHLPTRYTGVTSVRVGEDT